MQGNVLKIRLIDKNGNVMPADQLRTSLIVSLAADAKKVDDGEEYIIIQSASMTFDVRTENI